MAKTDGKPLPGDLVMLRGIAPRAVWVEPEKDRAGMVMPESVGIVIASAHNNAWRFYSYVLWSMPCICGWIQDGFLRKA